MRSSMLISVDESVKMILKILSLSFSLSLSLFLFLSLSLAFIHSYLPTKLKYKMRSTPNRQHPPLQPKPLGGLGSFFSWEYIRDIDLGSP